MTASRMSSTLVIQSHRDPLPFAWLKSCITSVKNWSTESGYHYRWLGDELLAPVSDNIRAKTKALPVIASDLGRLYALREGLKTYERAVWLDADFLIFDPENFRLPAAENMPLDYLLGREVWVQSDPERPNKLKTYTKVHNAFLLFDRTANTNTNSFLEFYLSHAKKLLIECNGNIPPQFIGPKLLTAIHNVVGCPVFEQAGMLSPAVIDDLLSNGTLCCALNLMLKRSSTSLAGANLCSSLTDDSQASETKMAKLVHQLLDTGAIL